MKTAEIQPTLLGQAIPKATNFLQKAQLKNGAWRDFITKAGESSEWVTAYVACALLVAHENGAAIAVKKAWSYLLSCRWWGKGWGYSWRIPSDADSTIWALLLAEKLQQNHRRKVKRSYRFLKEHIAEKRGVKTYHRTKLLRLLPGFRSVDFKGWCSPHNCVTVAALQLKHPLPRKQLLDFLLQQQHDEGYWSAYWWEGPEYTTALAIQALQKEYPSDHSALMKALHWALHHNCPKPDAFRTALHIQCLLPFYHQIAAKEKIDKLLQALLNEQNEDGSWNASASLRIPPPNYEKPEEVPFWTVEGGISGCLILDHRSVFTTATVLKTLGHFKSNKDNEL